MKIRDGFVSNSSSSSFLIRFEGEKTLDKCKKLIVDTYSDELSDATITRFAAQINELMTPYKGYKDDDGYMEEFDRKFVTDAEKKGYCLYQLILSDHSSESSCVYSKAREECLETTWGWNRPENVIGCESWH